jgi:hypothetical protein
MPLFYQASTRLKPIEPYFSLSYSINRRLRLLGLKCKQGQVRLVKQGLQSEEIAPPGRVGTILDECHCTHLTHFGELLLVPRAKDANSTTEDTLTEEQQRPLELVSTISCCVALACLGAVLVSAVFNKKLLKNPGQKIHLQLAANLTLLQSLYLVSLFLGKEQSQATCVSLSLAIIYALFANFVWMTVAGYLQYLRLVKVFYVRTSHMVQKAAALGWGVPLLPVLVLLGFTEDFTEPPLCSPKGALFYATVLVPLCLVLVLNLVFYALIVKNLFVDFKPRSTLNKTVSVLRFKQLVFMFALFGLNWELCCFPKFQFPTALEIDFCLHLFSISNALQGIAFLVLRVLLHESFKSYLRNLFCNANQADSSKATTNSSDLYRTTLSKEN